MMKVISVNCGLPREVDWHGHTVTTSIYKEPVEGRIGLRKLNLDGDRQSDLTVHGGEYKAVYCYSIPHYDYWRAELPGRSLPMGCSGRTSPSKDWTSLFILATRSRSVRPRLSSLSRGFPATSWASVLEWMTW